MFWRVWLWRMSRKCDKLAIRIRNMAAIKCNAVTDGNRLQIKPVQKQTRAGQRTRFKAVVVIGDSAGHIGLGIKTSKEVATAIRAAIQIAKLSVLPVRRGYWGTNLGEPHSLPVKQSGKCGSVTVRVCSQFYIPPDDGEYAANPFSLSPLPVVPVSLRRPASSVCSNLPVSRTPTPSPPVRPRPSRTPSRLSSWLSSMLTDSLPPTCGRRPSSPGALWTSSRMFCASLRSTRCSVAMGIN